jgi:transposase
MAAYSLDLRTRVLADCDRGFGTRVVATKYTVSESWVRRLKQRRRETGEVAARPPQNRRTPAPDAQADRIRSLIAARPDLTLQELHTALATTVCLTTVWAAVRRLGLTLKKKSCGRPSRTGRT